MGWGSIIILMKLIFLDTETTGNEIGKDRLCQICFKTEEDIFVGYFKPPVPVSIKAMSVTHITNKFLRDKEVFKESTARKQLQELLNKGVLVAHNAKFDIAILEAEGVSVPLSICTLRMARYLDKEGVIDEYNLSYLRYYLDIEVEGKAHDAENDVQVLEGIFNRQLKKMMEEIPDKDKAIEKMMEVSSRPTLFNKFNFGKHKGKEIGEVASSDRRYLEWLLAQKIDNPEAEEDWIYTLNHFLAK